MKSSTPGVLVILSAVVVSTAPAQGNAPALNAYGNPQRVKPAPTTAAITVRDLQIRLYQFADDSMQGRQVGRVGNMKGTDFIAAELKRMGIAPAGNNGSYFQVLPYHLRHFTDQSRLTINGSPLSWQKDWVAVPGARAPRPISGVEVIFGGIAGDTTRQVTAAQAAGKFVVQLPGAPPAGGAARSPFAPPLPTRFGGAVAVATVDLDALTPAQRAAINIPTVATQSTTGRGRGPQGPATVDSLTLLKQLVDQLAPQATLRLTKAAAAQLFGGQPVESMAAGTAGGTVNASLDFVELPSQFARNVVAIIPGSDPVLRHQYVAIGAH
ncbi:MAG: hypothetical protein H7066_21395, partial [Cytophagaceae bacterium]|nr:hypothetical protein [Gemmatimonadaceae bacterium]